MTNKNIILAVVLGIVIIGVGAYFLNPQSSYNPKTQGKVVFGITDAADNMGDVSSVIVTVNKVEMHSTANGWVTVSNDAKDYNLLALKQSGVVSLLANVNVDVGTYDQVRLMLGKVVVVKNGVQQEAKLPYGELKIVGNVVVNADKTSSIVFDFIADKSLHVTDNGKLIFAPVVKVKKQDDVKVELKSNDEVDITEGKNESDEDFGMDSKGEVKVNFEIKNKLKIDLNDNIQDENDNQDNSQGNSNDQGNSNNKGNNDQGSAGENNKVVLNFSAQNNSGLSGTATLSGEDGDVKVTLKLGSSLLGLLSTTEPAHIHFGSCANIGGVKYPLNSVVNGESETKLNISMATLKTGLPLAINVHKSAADINTYIGCTDIKF